MADPRPAPPYGIPVVLEPLVTGILAPNPSPYTYHGTQTYLVGIDDVAVIDPGPDDADHVAAILSSVAGRPVRAIVVTHHHRDHSPAAVPLADATGAPVVGAAAFVAGGMSPDGGGAFDPTYAPDRVMAEGDTVSGRGWSLHAVATPGHTANHLAFALPQAQAGDGALFSGDHVMGWSTSVVSPPDGDMAAYMASLGKLLARTERVYYPGHGDPVADPRRLVRGMLGHRRQREGQILRALASGAATLAELTPRLYAGLDPRLLPAAQGSVHAHLIDLVDRGLVVAEGERWRAA